MKRHVASITGTAVLLLAFPFAGAGDVPLDRETTLADPVLCRLKILLVQRTTEPADGEDIMRRLGFPTYHESHSSLPKLGYKNEILLMD